MTLLSAAAMADLCCNFPFILPLFLPPKQYFSSALHSHNSRFSTIQRRSPHLPLLLKHSPFAASASDTVLISTHENSDGSILFRFGDPSEIEKNVEMEESLIMKEEREGEDTNESSMVQVMEGEDETEGTASVSTEASDRGESIFTSSNTLIAVEEESEIYEKSLATPVDIELPAVTSNKEIGGVSSPDLVVEQIETLEGRNEECTDSSPVEASIPDESLQMENTTVEVSNEESLVETSNDAFTSKELEISSIPGIEVGQQALNVEGYANKEDVDSPAGTSTLDQSSEVVDNIATVALLEKESDDISLVDIDADRNGMTEEGLNGDYEDGSSEVENGSAVILLENETGGDTSTSDIEIQPTENVEERINEEHEESLVDTSVLDERVEVLNNTKAALSENEAADITSAPYEECPVDASVLDNSSEVEYGISALVSLEKDTDGNTSTRDIEIEPTGNVEESKIQEYEDSRSDVLDDTMAAFSEKEAADVAYAPDIDTEHTGNGEQGLDEAHKKPSLVEASRPDERTEVESCITAQEFSEKDSDDATTPIASKTDPVVPALDTDADQGGLETVVTTNVVPISELQNAETAIQDEIIGDDRESCDDNLVSPSSDSEAAVSLYEETVELVPSLQAEMQSLATEESSETDMDNIEVVEMQNVLSNDNESDVSGAEDESPSMEPAMAWSIGSEEQASGSGSGVSYETAVYESEKDVIQLATVSPQLEADSMLEEGNGEAGSMLEEGTGDANSVLEEETREANSVLEEETGEAKSVLEEETGEADPMLEEETGAANSVLKEETAEADSVLEKENGEANSVLVEETGEANSVLEEETGEADSMLEAETGEADSMLEAETGEADSMLEEETGEADSMLEEETGGANSVLEEETEEADSVPEEDTGTETVEELRKYDGSENQTVGGDLAEASVHEVTAPESIESTIKSQEILMTDFVLSSGAALLPHPSKVLTGGEDAYFIAEQTWFGVADGVSQWSLEGTIPGGYAQELIKYCEKLISDCSGNSINNPIELLNLSVAQTHSPGSSTVLIAQFDGQALHVANVGDSGFIILRHGAVYKRSSPMHHVFSFPVRIGSGDDPSSLAQLYKVDLEEEDIIVSATDGLLDNLYDQEILLIAMKSLADDKTPKEIAELLAKKAQEVGSSASARSPFADEAQAAGFPAYSGGMLDDVAVIVSLVRRR